MRCLFKNHKDGDSSSSAIYGLGVLGAIVYYISTASTFWMGAVGVLKAFVWPASVVFKVLEILQL